MTIWSVAFWKATAERVARAFFLTLASVWLVGEQTLDLRDIDWGSGLSLAGGTALGSLVLCMVAGLGVGPKGSPSLVRDPAAAEPTEDVERLADHDRKVQRAELEERIGHLPPPGQHRRNP